MSPDVPQLVLTDEQEQAIGRFEALARQQSFRVALLHGVTGSGKTEVYRRLAERVRALGRSVLILVPEIALTPAVAATFRRTFGDRVAIQHSGLSDGERHDQWHRIRRGDVDVVVGTRSAVFAPLDRLGLVIVDEEHDTSYKQEETPRYHGRDVAIVQARDVHALVVLGSATPALETYQNVSGRYECLTLTRRVLDCPLADVQVVNNALPGARRTLVVRRSPSGCGTGQQGTPRAGSRPGNDGLGALSLATWLILAALLAVVLYRCILATAYLLIGRRRDPSDAPRLLHHFAVVVPAHDEELLIGDVIRSIRDTSYPQDLIDVHVVADNCSDATAERARATGAEVTERREPDRPGKGQALAWMLRRLDLSACDAVAVFDADNLIDPDFFSAMSRELGRGACYLQGYDGISNPDESRRPRPRVGHGLVLLGESR